MSKLYDTDGVEAAFARECKRLPKRKALSGLALTTLESDILRHRLNVPDAIADTLADDYSSEDVESVCDALLSSGLRAACDINESIAHAVLVDAVEGSTYYGSGDGNNSPQRQSAVLRAGNSLAEKIGQLVGRELAFPDY